MRVFAIDPGSEQSGWVLLDTQPRLVLVDSGIHPNGDMLDWIRDGQRADVLAIEVAESFGQKVWAQVFVTTRWVGRMQQVWRQPDQVELVTRSQVKLCVAGKRAAKDADIRQCLIDRIGDVGRKATPGPLYGMRSHCWPALGVAVTVLEQRGIRVEPRRFAAQAPALLAAA